MTEEVPLTPLVEKVLDALGEHVLGQRPTCEALLATYMAGGHALLEGVPGVGKTLLGPCLRGGPGPRLSSACNSRPDLMPSDVIGANVFEQDKGSFRLVQGPGLHRDPDGRRDQPHAAQDPGRDARGHAGDPGDHRR